MDILKRPSLSQPQTQTSLERGPSFSFRESSLPNDTPSHEGGREQEEVTGFGVRYASDENRKSTELRRMLTRQGRACHSSNQFSGSLRERLK